MIALRSRLTWVVVAVILLLASPRAWAGPPQERHGFWIGLGGGYGSAGIDCEDCGSTEREGSFTAFVKLGGTLNEHVLLGMETNGWIKDEGTATLTLGSMTGTVTFYPRASSGFFLKGGAGAAFVNMEERFESVTVSVDKWGWGVLGGIGYDVRVGRNLSITPSVNYYFGRPGDLVFEDESAIRSFKQNVVDFTIGVTFH